MAFIPQRLLLAFGLLVGLLVNLGHTRVVDREIGFSSNLLDLSPRAPSASPKWPCMPDPKPKTPFFVAKDPGPSVPVPELTPEMVAEGNAQYGDVPSNATAIAACHTGAATSDGEIGRYFNQTRKKIVTDDSWLVFWGNIYNGDPRDMMIATDDLSVCTLLIVSSPYVAMVIHILERRDRTAYFVTHESPDQQDLDTKFVQMGNDILDQLLGYVGGNALSEYNGKLPRALTSVVVIGPAINPDYPFGYPSPGVDYTNPNTLWNTYQGMYYPNAAQRLLSMATLKLNVNYPGEIHSYRRRYHVDPAHKTDDRDKAVIVPKVV